MTGSRSLFQELRTIGLVGVGVIVTFFVFGVAWASMAPMAGAVVAGGQVTLANSHVTVQHLEGGILSVVKVREGDVVEPGQVLFEFQQVRTNAKLQELTNRVKTLASVEARLVAERDGAPGIDFRHPLLKNLDDREVLEIRRQQRHQLEVRRASGSTRKEILAFRITQIEEQIKGKLTQLDSVNRQLSLNRKELGSMQRLVNQGMATLTSLYSLQRSEASLMADRGELLATIAQAREKIGETRLQIMNLDAALQEEIGSQLTDIHAQRVGAEKLLADAEDQMRRTVVTSPIRGTIMNLEFTASNTVVRPGDTLAQIIPLDDQLLVEAQLATQDIDDVRVGQSARIVFSAFATRHLQRVDATVTRVSADALVDERSGTQYFGITVTVDPDSLAEAGLANELSPGMPAEVFVTTTERTLLDYLLQPVQDVLSRAFRES